MSGALPSIRGWIGMDISSFDIISPWILLIIDILIMNTFIVTIIV